jgi:hypothetical protein
VAGANTVVTQILHRGGPQITLRFIVFRDYGGTLFDTERQSHTCLRLKRTSASRGLVAARSNSCALSFAHQHEQILFRATSKANYMNEKKFSEARPQHTQLPTHPTRSPHTRPTETPIVVKFPHEGRSIARGPHPQTRVPSCLSPKKRVAQFKQSPSDPRRCYPPRLTDPAPRPSSTCSQAFRIPSAICEYKTAPV